jgi:hypothetical protein
MKMEFEAADKKAGMSLDELSQAVMRLLGAAKENQTDPNNAKVKVFVNMSAGIKTISAEV